MLNRRKIFLTGILYTLFASCDEQKDIVPFQLAAAYVGVIELSLEGNISTDTPTDQPILLTFSSAISAPSSSSSVFLKRGSEEVAMSISFLNDNKSILLTPSQPLLNNTLYSIIITDGLKSTGKVKFSGKQIDFKTVAGSLLVTTLKIGDNVVSGNGRIVDVPLTLSIEVNFSEPVKTSTLQDALDLTGPDVSNLQFSSSDDKKTITITRPESLVHLGKYTFTISNKLQGNNGESFNGLTKSFYTEKDETSKFPIVSDDALLTLVQKQTFRYFWDFGHPTSGMARERNTSGDLVTSGGSGFGLMAIVVGIERNFITRQQGLERLSTILDFLETADRFHGAWSHWIDGNTGDVIPFSAHDNGGDLVETSYLIQGLLTFRQYLNVNEAPEQTLIDRINALWETVEWDWYRQDDQNVLYWHWSPTVDWAMNHPVKGWNECLITYVLAAASPTHTIPKSVYEGGWASDGGMKNGNTFEGITLPLGPDYGGPLFFSQYSFLGINPSLSDMYADYWVQNVNHSKINHKYCIRNPKDFVGYSEDCWGLTASDNQSGYSAHSPTNDLGVITPTAALSSFPYTPDESMKALKFFYYTMGDRLFGEYGFYDAFNITEGWTANSYLAIDQGPIIIMIENYRSGLLWDLFMSAPEIQQGLTKLNFTVNQ